ncbi:MAG: hypothetical protein AMXMBFR84_26640 [Candidatus Hydrogenedentota bacterium]
MRISEVNFDQFMAWLGALDEDIASCEDAVRETMENVPLVERLMFIFNNALEDGAEEIMLMRNRDIANTLIALHQLEQGKLAPSRRTKHDA